MDLKVKIEFGFVFPERATRGSSPALSEITKDVGRLPRAEAGEDDGDGAGEDFEVEPEGPVVDVLEVEFHPLVKTDLVAAADLPDASEAGLHGEAAAMPGVVVLHLAGNGRARADENIPELGKLIDAGASQEMADGGDARVVLHLEDRAGHLVVGGEFGLQHL